MKSIDNLGIHHRRSIRLRGYDYSKAGLYFITLCVQSRECLFGEIVDGTMILNKFGECVAYTWNDLPNHNPHIELEVFCIMPNHVHFIVAIVGAGLEPALEPEPTSSNRAGLEPAPTNASLFEIVRQLKTFSAKRINRLRQTPGVSVWQRNYYEHIIRDEQSFIRIFEYIQNNPLRWDADKFYK